MKYTYKNPAENIHGGINCLILLDGEWMETSQDPNAKYELSGKLLADDWTEVKPLPKAEKDAHKKRQAEAVIIQKLTTLDLPAHTLAMAISGDSEAMDKVIKAETLKVALREELKAIK